MGIDIGVLDFLLKFRGRICGDTLQLGRQGIHIPRDPEDPLHIAGNRVLTKYGHAPVLATLFDQDGFSETLFAFLGARSTISLDASGFEGATIVHDLNLPVPTHLYNRFDTIFDGGTIEHIFDIRQVFENLRRMLKVGGLILSVNAANNQLGHGFYQFSPELMWRVFSKDRGFQVLLMQILVKEEKPMPIDAPDPKVVGRRIETRTTPGPTYLLVAAEKKFECDDVVTPQQSDYVTAWRDK